MQARPLLRLLGWQIADVKREDSKAVGMMFSSSEADIH